MYLLVPSYSATNDNSDEIGVTAIASLMMIIMCCLVTFSY